jgi:ubiquinone/menaquinone biosynthesis C-methylase UbiE
MPGGGFKNLELPEHSFDAISIFHVIHDIAPGERQDTVSLLCRKLKADGTIFVREPVKKSHGMPVSEIRNLFSNAGLIETQFQESESEYRGRFKPALTSN